MDGLSDKVAVVTGASRGIGADTARRLAQAGACVVCAARTLRKGDNAVLGGSLEETVASIESDGGRAIAVETNVANDDACRGLIAQALAAYGRVDVLVNNAAVGFFGPTLELKPSRWDLSWRITVSAPVLLSQLVLPGMLERGSGRIVNVSSESAIGPGAGPYEPGDYGVGDTAYGAQKAAIERFTQGLAQEVHGSGVGVMAVAPSLIVPTPGAVFNQVLAGPEDPRAEPLKYMPEAIYLLATLPVDDVSGRMVYSQQLLVEQGLLDSGRGLGVDAARRVTGYAAVG